MTSLLKSGDILSSLLYFEFTNSPDAVIIADKHHNIVRINQAYWNLSRESRHEVEGTSIFSLSFLDKLEGFRATCTRCVILKENVQDDFSVEGHGAIQDRMIHTTICTVDNYYVVRMFTIKRDMSKEGYFLYDEVTNLPSRSLLYKTLQNLIYCRDPDPFAVLFIDIDKFKRINDEYGHTIGDLYLQEFSVLLQASLRSSDFVSRFGGDEFIVVLKGTDSDMVHNAVDNLFTNLTAKPISVGIDKSIDVRISIGVATFPDGGKTEDALINHADISMYIAKNHGRNQVCYFDATDVHTDNYSLENKIIHSVRNHGTDDFFIVYQPQVHPRTLKVVGCEALLRWRDTKNNNELVSPSLFIPILEANSSMIVSIGEWVLHTACLDLLKYPQYLLCVNVSIKQLRTRQFVDMVKSVLADTKFDPSRLELEVTESVFISDTGQTRKTLLDLVELGIKISIDDFGSGYSSLNRLISLPITKLKIDGVFMRDFDSNRHSKQIVSAIVKIAKDLQLTVLVEGVETDEQYKYIRSIDCHEIQGFYFSKPLALEDFKNFSATVSPAYVFDNNCDNNCSYSVHHHL